MKRRLIIDCDPGADDAVLILMALAVPQTFDVLGITTVAGNAPIEWTNKNALKLVELAKRTDVKVFGGCRRPMLRKPIYAAYAHGETGIDGSSMPEPKTSLQSRHAVDFIIETLLHSSQKVTLSVSGPMTNIALALIKEPGIAEHIEEIIFMGGSTNGGNITPAAEFNFYVDPHAAHVVVSSGLPMKMIGLNVTHQLVTSEHRLEILQRMGNEVGRQVAGMLAHGVEHDRVRFGLEGRSVHDACIAAYMLRPELFTFKKMRVLVDHAGEATMGASITNEYPAHINDQWLSVADSIQADQVFDLIIDLMRTYKD
ncbi:MAG: nucleoside hydrolase [Caedimonas sp.]|nr:nucleoside hydrolase [Caedimonas sp.]